VRVEIDKVIESVFVFAQEARSLGDHDLVHGFRDREIR